MKITLYVGVLAGLLSLLSCGSLVQEVDSSAVPITADKLVIHSYISPQDTVLTVLVETATSRLGAPQAASFYTFGRKPLANAIVELSDGTRTVRLPAVGQGFGLYYSIEARSLPIVTGGTYTLTVNAPNFAMATAQCTVPPAVLPTEIRVDSAAPERAGQPNPVYSGRLIWQDVAGQSNFYWVTGRSYQTVLGPPGYYQPDVSRDTTIIYDDNLEFVSSTLASDRVSNGQRFISPKGEITNYRYSYSNTNRVLASRIVMTLNNADENFYRYREAVEKQRSAVENPFAEPVIIPSNIQGGFGCFGAYNGASLTVKIK